MARQNQLVEVNSFVKGLITEASPLTFPENSSLDEDNFNLLRDGSRERRAGMNLEEGAISITPSTTIPDSQEIAVSTFSWENVGGRPDRTYIVVQTGRVLKVFNPDEDALSTGEVYTTDFPAVDQEQLFSYANIDGDLVVVTGDKYIRILSYDGTNFNLRTDYLRTRDLWGVEDVVEGVNLNEGQGVSTRPATITGEHVYNLRNQTWATLREDSGSTRDRRDTIPYFSFMNGAYPSNADNTNYALYPNANDSDNRTGDQFYPKDLGNNPPGTMPAPKGYFIIDAMARGLSRLEEAKKLHDSSPIYQFTVDVLPSDVTPGGPSSVAEYAGRIWYAGFQGTVLGGDARSPALSSYVFYSQLVNEPSQIAKCYQEGDPTSKESPDLLDTDGGYIRVDGAYNIQALVSIGVGILVLAENGIWMIRGGSDYGFSANNNMRQKISSRGIKSPGSVVTIDNTVMFWAEDAIYHVAPDQFGEYQAQNLTQNTIQSFYDEIAPADKFFAKGNYDSYDQKVRWVYQNRIREIEPSKELVFDLNLGAFYTHTIETIGESGLPRVAAPIELPAFRLNEEVTNVTYNGEQVVYNNEIVNQRINLRDFGTRELGYVVFTGTAPITYTFARYRDVNFKDWVDVDGVGVDAPAYLVTGYLSGGDFMRDKQVPYIEFHFIRTEDGFTDDGTGNLTPTNQSGCIVQAQWEWTNTAASNRWGRPFQAYRYQRHYMATGPQDSYDTGFAVLTTKNKLRGKGKVLSLKISTEPGKDCQLLGWSMLVGITGNV